MENQNYSCLLSIRQERWFSSYDNEYKDVFRSSHISIFFCYHHHNHYH